VGPYSIAAWNWPGGIRILQKENMRLIKLVVDQDLDNAIFKEAAKENW
jgi:hypothetical protein